jgi:dynein heavy chain, axonemal
VLAPSPTRARPASHHPQSPFLPPFPRLQRAPVFGPGAGAPAARGARGYFGDVGSVPLADATAGPSAERAFGGSAGGGVRAPFAYAFKSAGGGAAALSRRLHSHAEHSTEGGSSSAASSSSTQGGASYNPYADVPERALQPKVFVPHARTAGSTAVPRKVAVERKRREFASAVSSEAGGDPFSAAGLEGALRDKGVDYAAVPGGDAAGLAKDNASASPSSANAELAAKLPLEAFDSSDYETRTAPEWVGLGVDEATGQQRGVPGFALCAQPDGTGYWRPCRAVAWEAEKSAFTVVWTDQERDASSASSAASAAASSSRTRANLSAHIAASSDLESKEGDAKAAAELVSLVPGGTGAARVRRIHMCFASEDPAVFAARLATAFASRRTAASLLRYHLSIDCMPTDDSPQLVPAQADRVQRAALAARSLQAAAASLAAGSNAGKESRDRAAAIAASLSSLLAEANTDFARTMNKIIFDRTVAAARSAGASAAAEEDGGEEKKDEGAAGGMPGGLAMLAAVDMPAPARPPPVPERALVAIPAHDFPAVKESFGFQSLLTKEEVISLLQRVSAENMKTWHKGALAATVGFLVGAPGKSVKLDEFEATNASATNAYAAFLKEGWASVVRNHVRHCLGSVGKGHFNLKETNAKAYEYSKLRRLLRVVNYRMGDELRYATDAQLSDYAAVIEAACDVVVEVSTPAAVTVTSKSTGQAFRRPPLFAVDVVVKDDVPAHAEDHEAAKGGKAGADGKPKKKKAIHTGPVKKVFGFSVDPAGLAAAPLNAFDAALKAIAGVKTVERQVMDRLFWPEEPVVPTVHPLEPHVVATRDRMAAALAAATAPLSAYIATFEPYAAFLNLDVEEMVAGMKAKIAANGFVLADCKTAIQKARDSANALIEELPQAVSVGIALVSVTDVRATLIKKQLAVGEGVLKLVASYAADTSSDIIKQYDIMIKALSQPTSDIESLTAVKEFMAACPDKVREQEGRAEANGQCYGLLESYVYPLPKDQFELQWKAVMGPSRIFKKIAEVEAALEREKNKYMEDMAAEQAAFDESLGSLADDVAGLSTFTKMEDVETAAAGVARTKLMLDAAEEKGRLFNTREGLFGKEITNYDRIGEIKKTFEPFYTLWDTANAWLKQHKSWMQDAFVNINAELIEREAGAMGRNMTRSVKAFEKIGIEGCLVVAKEIRDQTEGFKPLIPLVIALRNPGMRARHWAELSDAIGEKIDPDRDGPNFTLTHVINMNLARHIEVITKVGEKAGKEYQLEQALDKMAGEWAGAFLDIVAYRETGTYVIKGVDELQALLDEHNTMTQAMTFSAFKKPFAERIDTWAQTLNVAGEVLDEWVKVQRSWLYLEPIFSSSDIQKQLPTEYKRFATVDKNWRATLLAGRGGPGNNAQPQKAIQFCNNAKLLEKWQESNKYLDLVQKGLADYLETKRAGFARFYFLSNDELLEILSQTKDPRAVQPHLKKCFEGVRTVEFLPTTEINVMISGEKEKIDLAYNVDPRGKNVEVWMSEFEECMKKSIRSVMYDAIVDYTVIPRTKWVQKWAGQCVLNASQLHWTREIEDGIKEKGNDGVKLCYEQQVSQLKDIVELIRGKLDPLARITLGSLTVVDVHARDVTKKMWQVGVATINDFEWISQLRYTWLGEGKESGDMWVQMVSSVRPYGYEYLGNSLRLVITPLTDKCYMTIMSALQMNLGGAPAGPAGTGKTETTKDLAKALAMYW